MKRIPLHCSMLALLAFLFACHDKPSSSGESPCSQPGNCQSVLEAKDFFLFKVGSYWVYEEETTHDRDSMYVTLYSNDEFGYNFYVRIKSALTDYEYNYWPTFLPNIDGCNQTGKVIKRCLYVNRSKGKFQDNLGESHVFYFGYHSGDWHYSGSTWDCTNNKVTIGAIYDSYELPVGTFQEVVRIDQDCEYAEGKQPTKFFYAKNVGIIRKELIDSNQVWNLVNHYVIQ